MHTIDIPGGQATIRDVKDLKVRQRRMVERASYGLIDVISSIPGGMGDLDKIQLSDLKLTKDDVGTMVDVQDAVILALLEGWTLEQPVPKSVDDLMDMDVPLYDALAQGTKELGAQLAASSDFGVSPDPKAPTSASESSNGASLAAL